jgi:hypothetical protein
MTHAHQGSHTNSRRLSQRHGHCHSAAPMLPPRGPLARALWSCALVTCLAAGCGTTGASGVADADGQASLDGSDAQTDSPVLSDAANGSPNVGLDGANAQSAAGDVAVGVPLPSACTTAFENPADVCTAMPCPVTANVAMRCPLAGFHLSVAAGMPVAQVSYTAATGGYFPVLFTLDLGAKSAQAEVVPTSNWPAKVYSTTTGGGYLAAYSADGATHDAMAVYTRQNGAWQRSDLEGGAYVRIELGNGVHHPDGRESFVYSRGDATGDYRTATRAVDGTWTTATLRSGSFSGLFGIDIPQPDMADSFLFASWYPGLPDNMSRTMGLGTGSAAPAPIFVQPAGTQYASNQYGPDSYLVAIASRAGSAPVVALGLADGVHVLVGSAAGYADNLVAGTARGSESCVGLTAPPCPGSCIAQGTVGAGASHDLVRTSDGRVWLVYLQLHIDRDYQFSNQPNSASCSVMTTADRSRIELVVVEVGTTLTERARLSWPEPGATNGFDVDAIGSVLQMAWLGASDQVVPNPIFIRFVALETNGLH